MPAADRRLRPASFLVAARGTPAARAVVDQGPLLSHVGLDSFRLLHRLLADDDFLLGDHALLDDELLVDDRDPDLLFPDLGPFRHARVVDRTALDDHLLTSHGHSLEHVLGVDDLPNGDLAGLHLAPADCELLLGEHDRALLSAPEGLAHERADARPVADVRVEIFAPSSPEIGFDLVERPAAVLWVAAGDVAQLIRRASRFVPGAGPAFGRVVPAEVVLVLAELLR